MYLLLHSASYNPAAQAQPGAHGIWHHSRTPQKCKFSIIQPDLTRSPVVERWNKSCQAVPGGGQVTLSGSALWHPASHFSPTGFSTVLNDTSLACEPHCTPTASAWRPPFSFRPSTHYSLILPQTPPFHLPPSKHSEWVYGSSNIPATAFSTWSDETLVFYFWIYSIWHNAWYIAWSQSILVEFMNERKNKWMGILSEWPELMIRMIYSWKLSKKTANVCNIFLQSFYLWHHWIYLLNRLKTYWVPCSF